MLFETAFPWWGALCAFAALNVLAWSATALTLDRRAATLGPDTLARRRLHLALAAVYVAGCAWRSVFPVFDVPRIVLIDSPLSSIAIGRSVATVAELCFAAQWALLLRELAQATGSATARVLSRQLLPMIVLAEVCSWYSVLSTSNLGHVLEEALWGLGALLVVAGLATAWPRCGRAQRALLALGGLAALAYAAYMFGVDVPRYWQRWQADEAAGQAYLQLAPGLADALARRHVLAGWDAWRGEAGWMTLYFVVGVWASIALVHLPPLRTGAAPEKRPQRRAAAP